MDIIISVGVQFMLKDRNMDMPKMLPRECHDYTMSVSVSPELRPYLSEYAESANDPSYHPQYEIGDMLLNIITPRVKKAYPEHWRKEKTDDGTVIHFAPTKEVILETAIRMEVDDVIDELLEDNKSEVLSELNIELPKDDDEFYLANTFLTNLGWRVP